MIDGMIDATSHALRTVSGHVPNQVPEFLRHLCRPFTVVRTGLYPDLDGLGVLLLHEARRRLVPTQMAHGGAIAEVAAYIVQLPLSCPVCSQLQAQEQKRLAVGQAEEAVAYMN